MKKTIIMLGMLAYTFGISAQDKLYPNEFPLSDVNITGGVLKHAQDLNVQTLLQYDVDRLMAPYRKEAGLEPRKPSYPNWDGLDGHVGGHYLTAMAINAGRITKKGDKNPNEFVAEKQCRERMLYMISELKECAEASARNHPDWGVGYLGGVPNSKNIWPKFAKGDFSTFNGAWVPLYNIHKMYAGLRDAWVYCGNEDAKNLFLGFCDWAINITANLSDEQMEQMLGVEHGGMNEVLADAYHFTGDKRYLDCAKRFSHKWLLNPMLKHEGKHLDNIHANTQVPKVIGFERIATLCNDADYRESATFFWDEVVNRRSLALGGNSRREHFPSKESCIDWTQDIDGLETCNTNNMLKLTEMFFMEKPQAKFADFYERAVFNHILSSQHPEHGGYVYFTSARPRHYRNYSVPNEAMWCCVGTGMENHGKYGQFIYTHNTVAGKNANPQLFVNLFVPSTLNWKEQKIQLEQETEFPYGESSVIKITKGKKRFELNLRYPSWVSKGDIVVLINGKRLNVYNNPGSYITIERTWHKGDKVEVRFPMHNSIERMPNVPQYVALMHGPIVLAMNSGTEDLAMLKADDSRFGQLAVGKKLPVDKAPYLLADKVEDLARSMTPVPGKPLHFTLTSQQEGNKTATYELEPFFALHDARYMLYWLALGKDDYKSYLDNLAREEEARLALDAATVDKVQPGEQQPEADHFMETDDSWKGVTNDVPFRDARSGHYFSYKVQTKGKTDLALRIRYWGQDEWSTREYDIYVDDVKVKEVRASRKWRSSQWKYETYPIPAEVLKGKDNVRIKFVAVNGCQVGGIYEMRLVEN